MLNSRTAILLAFLYALAMPAQRLHAAPLLLVDVESGSVIYAHDEQRSWHPASITKLMTANVALKAVRLGLATLETPVTISARAASVAPSRLGAPPGTVLRLEDALRIMLTKSTNDVATALAESLAGSEPRFVGLMNDEASRLGMAGTRFLNASGLPAEAQVTTAEDLAILARHIVLAYPEAASLFATQTVVAAGKTLRSTNGLLGRYAGADGLKTGYVCSSGFNIVTTATRAGRRVIAVVLGAPSVRAREDAAARLMDLGFALDPASGGLLRSHSKGPAKAADLTAWKCGRTYPDFHLPEKSHRAAPGTSAEASAGSRRAPPSTRAGGRSDGSSAAIADRRDSPALQSRRPPAPSGHHARPPASPGLRRRPARDPLQI